LSYGRYAWCINDLGESFKVAEWARVKEVLKRNAASRTPPSRKLLYRLKTSNVLWSRNFHNREMVNSSSAHIRDDRMPETMEMKTLDTSSATSSIERRSDGTAHCPLTKNTWSS